MQEFKKGYTINSCMKNIKRLVMATLSVLIFLGACSSKHEAATEETAAAEETAAPAEASSEAAAEPAAAAHH